MEDPDQIRPARVNALPLLPARAKLLTDGGNDLRIQSLGGAGKDDALLKLDVLFIKAFDLAGSGGELFLFLGG